MHLCRVFFLVRIWSEWSTPFRSWLCLKIALGCFTLTVFHLFSTFTSRQPWHTCWLSQWFLTWWPVFCLSTVTWDKSFSCLSQGSSVFLFCPLLAILHLSRETSAVFCCSSTSWVRLVKKSWISQTDVWKFLKYRWYPWFSKGLQVLWLIHFQSHEYWFHYGYFYQCAHWSHKCSLWRCQQSPITWYPF